MKKGLGTEDLGLSLELGARNPKPETRNRWTKLYLLTTDYRLLTTIVFFLFCLAACSPTYVLRAGYEEAKILWNRRPIAEVLARADVDPVTREKLELVLRVRRFVEQELAFNVGGSYSTITELDKPPVVYVVTAAPRTKLEPYTWWFPIVGQVAYKGYFDQADAQQEARRLPIRSCHTCYAMTLRRSRTLLLMSCFTARSTSKGSRPLTNRSPTSPGIVEP